MKAFVTSWHGVSWFGAKELLLCRYWSVMLHSLNSWSSFSIQGVEFLYAAATATQVAYNTYIYAQVPIEKFQVVTGYTQAALLAGRCLGGILGQVLVATGLCDYYTLNFVSLAFVSAATVVSLFLPSVEQSIYFHRGKNKDAAKKRCDSKDLEEPPDVICVSSSQGEPPSPFRLLWIDFTSSYSNSYMLKWSLWWAFAMCGYFQVLNYIQPLWETIAPTETTLYNGAVEAVHTFLSNLLMLFCLHNVT